MEGYANNISQKKHIETIWTIENKALRHERSCRSAFSISSAL